MIRKHPVLAALLVALVAALSFAACGDDDDEETTAAGETTEQTTTEAQGPYGGGGAGAAGGGGGGETIPVAETDFALDPANVTASAGEVTFELANDGQSPHNLEVEGNGVEEVSETIDPGQQTEFTVDLDPGTYVIYCAIGGHRELGMEGELTVE